MQPLNETIHLVGSLPLSNSADVFTTVCSAFGGRLHRIPDGEAGERSGWISFEHAMLEKNPAVMLNPAGRTEPIRDLKGGVSAETKLYLGLVNPHDPDDDQGRIAATRSHLPNFGIATECGWGRKTEQKFASLQDEHIAAFG